MSVTSRTTKNGGAQGFFQNEFLAKLFVTLLFVLLVYIIVLFATMIRNNIAEHATIGRAEQSERLINFHGEGKVVAAPDTAIISIGMLAESKTVAEAQAENTKVMNRLIERLETFGIDSKDIQTTHYNVYPKYNYTETKGQTLEGYSVSQNVTVKIRDLGKANAVLGLVGEVGANSVSGLSFVIDEPQVYKEQARQIAIQKVMQQSRGVSRALGISLGDIVAYEEFEDGKGGPFPYYTSEKAVGGESPEILSGSQEIIMNVMVTFEIGS